VLGVDFGLSELCLDFVLDHTIWGLQCLRLCFLRQRLGGRCCLTQPRKSDGQNQQDSATILVRANEYGQDIPAKQITQTGWWTFGMTFTPDGMVHYYAKPGVGRLTAADRLASTIPYGTKVENFNTIFFNIVNMDDGRTWSTEWIVDDPEIFVLY